MKYHEGQIVTFSKAGLKTGTTSGMIVESNDAGMMPNYRVLWYDWGSSTGGYATRVATVFEDNIHEILGEADLSILFQGSGRYEKELAELIRKKESHLQVVEAIDNRISYMKSVLKRNDISVVENVLESAT